MRIEDQDSKFLEQIFMLMIEKRVISMKIVVSKLYIVIKMSRFKKILLRKKKKRFKIHILNVITLYYPQLIFDSMRIGECNYTTSITINSILPSNYLISWTKRPNRVIICIYVKYNSHITS